jgi:hypothetical protein
MIMEGEDECDNERGMTNDDNDCLLWLLCDVIRL